MGRLIINNKLLKCFMLSWGCVIAVFLLGPYQYLLYSKSSILYLLLVNICMVLGLCSGELIKIKSKSDKQRDTFDKNEDLWFLILEIIVIISFVYWCLWFFRVVNIRNYSFGSDYRYLISENRNNLNRVAEFILNAGVAIFVMVDAIGREKSSSVVYKLSYLVLWIPAVAYILRGARWGVVVSLLVFLYTKIKDINLRKMNASRKNVFLAVTCIIVVGIFILKIFSVRTGINVGGERRLFEAGDMNLKKWADKLYDMTDGAVDPLYGLAYYIGQPIPVFSKVFSEFLPSKMYYGRFLLSPFENFFKVLSIPIIKFDNPGWEGGLYTPYVYGFIVDFGIYLTPIVVFIIGAVFAKIQKAESINFHCRALQPILSTMMLASPVYYFFHVGGISFVLMWYLGITIFFELKLRINNHMKKNEG